MPNLWPAGNMNQNPEQVKHCDFCGYDSVVIRGGLSHGSLMQHLKIIVAYGIHLNIVFNNK